MDQPRLTACRGPPDLPRNRPNCREVLECGGWRGTGLTPLWQARGGPKRKRCVPSPLTHRTPKRWRAGRGWRWFRGAWSERPSGSSPHEPRVLHVYVFEPSCTLTQRREGPRGSGALSRAERKEGPLVTIDQQCLGLHLSASRPTGWFASVACARADFPRRRECPSRPTGGNPENPRPLVKPSVERSSRSQFTNSRSSLQSQTPQDVTDCFLADSDAPCDLGI